MAEYSPAEIEPRWQRFWDEEETFRVADDTDKPKFYVLDMFPYPSGSGLHIGHPEGYTATDIVARYKRMRGFNVLHPMGWDAFGLPAERHAMRTGEHPSRSTARNIDTFRRQLKALGFSYDWSREVSTAEPDYYRWTQWIFLKLYEEGLAYEAEVPVNWCPAQGTVLANEEVQDGVYVETGDPVERRNMRQWMLKITAYAERLLEDLDTLDWPDSVKEMQRHWIGRSEGADVIFPIVGLDETIEIYTTRPDTLFGATYMVLAPEHPLVDEITTEEQRDAVEAYVEQAANKSDLDRTDLAKEKSGVFTGGFAINPVNGEEIPVWVGDYVLMSYGTGAIMAVPAHDERDWEFAKTFDLPIVEVIEGGDVDEAAHVGDGTLVNSDFLDGLDVASAKARITDWLEESDKGQRAVRYRLRDWLFSRQRYWGEPIPMLHREDGEVVPVPEDALPLTLPELDEYRPTDDGAPPLARAEDWVRTTDPETGQPARRETNTMPQWAGSCWYYLRFIDPGNDDALVDPEKERYWMSVDLYVGGVEHAVLHLLYARFWHKVLYDIGVVSTKEPFQKLVNQGMILGTSYQDAQGKYYPESAIEKRGDAFFVAETGEPVESRVEKMSKTKLNGVSPDEVIAEFGADALRLYEMYMGPLEQTKPWSTDGARGMYRFLARVYRLITGEGGGLSEQITGDPPSREVAQLAHRTTAQVTEDIESMAFNTGIARMIEMVNELYKLDAVPRSVAERLVLLISPFAPHLAEELWRTLGRAETIAYEDWPTWDEALLVEETITVALQVMGKTRGTIDVPADASEEAVLEAARAHERVAAHIEGKSIRREIYVPGRVVNFIVG